MLLNVLFYEVMLRSFHFPRKWLQRRYPSVWFSTKSHGVCMGGVLHPENESFMMKLQHENICSGVNTRNPKSWKNRSALFCWWKPCVFPFCSSFINTQCENRRCNWQLRLLLTICLSYGCVGCDYASEVVTIVLKSTFPVYATPSLALILPCFFLPIISQGTHSLVS